MKYPDNLLYSKSHEWLQELEDGSVLIGITAYAAEQMGGVVYVDLPEADDEAELGESFAEAESVKAVSEIISPVSGVISVVNQDLEDQPNLLNDSPMTRGLFVSAMSANAKSLWTRQHTKPLSRNRVLRFFRSA